VAVIEKKLAWEKVFKTKERVKEKRRPQKLSIKTKEEEIARMVKESRKKK